MQKATRLFVRSSALVLSLLAGATMSSAVTFAYWNFDQGTAGTPFSTTPATDLSGNGFTMFGFNEVFGPSYSTVGATPTGVGLSSRNAGQDGYTAGATALNAWSPVTWTIELSVKLDNQGGWNTIIGRDGSNAGPESNFYFQNNGINDRFRVNFLTVGGGRTILDSDFIGATGVWYQFAIVSDGTTVTMYTDKFDGNGYQSVGSTLIAGTGSKALAQNGANWTFGRGWYNGSFVDNITGNLDNIRFSDVALTPGEFLAIPEPSTFASLAGLAGLAFVAMRRRRSRD